MKYPTGRTWRTRRSCFRNTHDDPQTAPSEAKQLSATPMRDDTKTNNTVSGNSCAALESNGNGVAVARSAALRGAYYASLTRRAVTDNSNALIDDVLHLIGTAEARERQRGTKAKTALRQAAEGFVGDLLVALAKAQHSDGDVAITEHCNNVAGWVRRSTSSNSFSGGPVSFRTFDAIRAALTALGLVEEVPGVTQFREVFGKQFVLNRYDTRWRATARLEELAAARSVSLLDIGRHFVSVPQLPKHPLILKGTSTWLGGYKINGKRMKIVYTAEIKALEEVIIDLNAFIDKFTIVGGRHHGYIREFNCGDHPTFAWDLGGRLYSVGDESYQGLSADERKLMTIDGRPVIELDIRASALTIFHGQKGQPLDFEANPDPYTLPELSDTQTAREELAAANTLKKSGRNGLQAYHNAGQAIEFLLKAIYLKRKNLKELPDTCKGARWHSLPLVADEAGLKGDIEIIKKTNQKFTRIG
jgi:hypothetical protein